ncbi:hypothetical protein F383_11378 [Gossypium arboreum]|uniref:Uncharacterized protein n=1 Tax=Gossypium arboreum TaxID=29729 RepID=A0A0B0NK73_GOSAR|nr:hypothetical protein F383_16931 [Gossypium arboreum]KHG28789.1 hypothetical protein F383_11378 [Gossypium arboreum]
MCKTISGTLASYMIRVRPCQGQWHRYLIICKTTSGTLVLCKLSELSEYPYLFRKVQRAILRME